MTSLGKLRFIMVKYGNLLKGGGEKEVSDKNDLMSTTCRVSGTPE